VEARLLPSSRPHAPGHPIGEAAGSPLGIKLKGSSIFPEVASLDERRHEHGDTEFNPNSPVD
jgi:hypothetical protein